jgi:biopolymer transport protein ExbD
MLLAACASTPPEVPMRLYVREASYEINGDLFPNSAALEAFLRDRKPARIYVVPARDATYEQVRDALVAIQRVGGVDVSLTGDETPK